jgi:drug/metabolite transporter (DMT)-like permease
MTKSDLFELILLAAIWGASYLFMRVSVPEFGAIPMIFMRVLLAGLCLLPLVFWKGQQRELLDKLPQLTIVGLINSAIPFTLIGYSTLYLSAGFASVINAATPLFTAIIGYLWLKNKLSSLAIAGLFIGFFGVVLLVWNKMNFSLHSSTNFAIIAGLAGACCYGLGANYTKKSLSGFSPLVFATGSLLMASLFMLPFAIFTWPVVLPSKQSWMVVIILAVVCTGLAQIIYFRLIDRVGAGNATTVTFLIPVFGLIWGNFFLGEIFQIETLIACGVIIMGTGLTTGIISVPKKSILNAKE